ncbi:hypothetical protein PHET_09959 [Paragonimus heterotremus]|uniref:ABC transmembrane type-1 domain-containing protein n=1 Tax=Paragonimus heterotremus TaxID=100268 RepID=A0A8J4SRR3_9TREM|nr:hypothetical protein PHET_09959 [Paragonimus heterotremus]
MGLRDKLMPRVNNADKNSSQEDYPKVSFFKLFRYADAWDLVSLILGLILSAGVGAIGPSNVLIFRDLVNTLVDNFDASKAYPSCVWFVILGCIMLAAAFTQASLLSTSSKRQLSRIRLLYFKAILRQDVPWFDRQSSGALISKLSENTSQIEMGIGTKLVAGSVGLSIFCSAALIFWYGVKLIREEAYDPGSVLLVFINVIMGSIFLGNALPNFQYFMNAATSAREIYGTIERVSLLYL